MPDHNDEPDLAGNETGSTQVSEQRSPHSNGDASPASAQRASRVSEGDPPKKKRKVNHACVYCRRSHMTCDSDRPCKRCIKRNIGHLCHDEPREGHHKKSKSESDQAGGEEPTSPKQELPTTTGLTGGSVLDDTGQELVQDSNNNNNMGMKPMSNDAPSVPDLGPMAQTSGINGNGETQFGYNEQWLQPQNRFQDMHAYHPNFMFNANEVTDEYNLLNDFLSTSLLDEAGMFSTEDFHGTYNDPSFVNSMAVSFGNNNGELLANQQITSLQPNQIAAMQAAAISRPSSTKPASDKAREKYYMTAADPAGNDPPEERMNKLLKAKYDAGLLKPFNYVNGYARLNKYMEKNMKHSSRHKILMQLDQFRPKFRERMQCLTDIELVLVEMWFERNLMEYDRVFASMAIPACCWRRTGEIFRGNKEMAELIHVPIESLRDGKLAIHEIVVEDQLVSYWEKFCAICFDQQQKAMLTSCTLRSPTRPDHPEIHCCFSFTIKRDNHNIPSLIVGNFLPMDPVKA